MGIQEEDDAPTEAPLSKSKKYVVVKNHVRELLPEVEGLHSVISDTKAVENSNSVERKSLKRKKALEKVSPSISEPTTINESDLEELRTVYKKCKEVVQKIESKYGHLFTSEDKKYFIYNTNSKELNCDNCSCPQTKKIVFDDNGKQVEKYCQIENHICVKRTKRSHSDSHISSSKPSVKVEYENIFANLPNDLSELASILRDETISKTYRRMVIDKFYILKQEYLNEVRYERRDIIKRLKENPDEVFDFRGTNLSILRGYPNKPGEKIYEE